MAWVNFAGLLMPNSWLDQLPDSRVKAQRLLHGSSIFNRRWPFSLQSMDLPQLSGFTDLVLCPGLEYVREGIQHNQHHHR